jgi:hypothetical protein
MQQTRADAHDPLRVDGPVLDDSLSGVLGHADDLRREATSVLKVPLSTPKLAGCKELRVGEVLQIVN